MKDYEAVLKQVAGRMMHMKQDGIQEKYPVSLLDMEAWEWQIGRASCRARVLRLV